MWETYAFKYPIVRAVLFRPLPLLLERKANNAMPFIPVPATAEFHVSFTMSGQICENVLHFKRLLDYTVPQLSAVCQGIADAWNNNFKSFIPNTITLNHIEAFGLHSESAPGTTFTLAPLPATGLNATPQLPNNVTLAIKWLTASRGRSFRGRTFHIGLSETAIDGNNVNAPALTALTTAYASWLGVGLTTGDQMVVVSRFHNNAPRAIGIATIVTNFAIDTVVDSQRRRLPGRGP